MTCSVGKTCCAVLALASTSSGQFVFEAPDVYSASAHNPSQGGLAVGDVDGDGFADMVFAAGDVGAELFLNQGDGTFGSPLTVASAPGPGNVRKVRLGDLDGDGDLDLVIGTQFSLQVLLNDGAGMFGAQVTVYDPPQSSAHISEFALVEATGDAALDLVLVSNLSGGGVFVVPGIGDGTFESPLAIDFPVPQCLWTFKSPHVGDLDGDGVPELVVFFHCLFPVLSYASVFPGLGGGRFGPPETLFLGPDAQIALAEVTGDGMPDLLIGSEIGLGVALGDGQGGFEEIIAHPGAHRGHPAVADFDGDGHADIALEDSSLGGSQLAFFRGSGTAHFQQVLTVTGVQESGEAVAADFDGDGRPDVALAWRGTGPQPGTVSVLRNHTYGIDDPFTDLGFALGSVEDGLPVLPIQIAAGTFVGGEPVSFHVENVQHSGSAVGWFVVGISGLFAPFAGGTLVPMLDAVYGPFPLGSASSLEFSGPMPLGLPSGVHLWTQFWIQGMSSLSGFAATTAVVGVTPADR